MLTKLLYFLFLYTIFYTFFTQNTEKQNTLPLDRVKILVCRICTLKTSNFNDMQRK